MISTLTFRPAVANAQPTPPQPPAPTLDEAYASTDATLLSTQAAFNDPQTAAAAQAQARETASATFAAFKDSVVNASQAPQLAEQARQAATQALVQGMICGGLDTLLLFATDAGSQAATPPGKGWVSDSLDELKAKRQEELAAAKESLKEAGTAALQGASAQAKVGGAALADYAGQEGWDLWQFQTLQSSAFAVGYSVGVTDGALVSFGQPLTPA